MALAKLPSATVKLIGSSQVITSVSSVVKELMENSIDAGAQQIEIKLEKHGLEKIEVKDDGCGIGKSDVPVMCVSSYTSKISDFSDLDDLSSYGFRGEALSSLCNVANVSVTTKTAQDDVATCYTFDHNGQVTCSKTSHIVKGTIVTVTELFKSLPVRKQFMSNSKRAAEELKKIEKVVKSLAVVHPRLRVTLVHNKFLCWQKTSVSNLRQSVMQVIPIGIAKQLHHILHKTEQIRVEMLVPKSDCNVPSLCYSNFSDAHFLFINQRPVRNKEVEKVVYDKLFEYFGVYTPVNKYPFCVTCLNVPPDCLDVNLEPNKTRVYLKDQENVLDIVKQCMLIYYDSNPKEIEEENAVKPVKKRKIELENLEINEKKTESSLSNSEEMEISEQIVTSNSSNKDLDSDFVKFCLKRGEKMEDDRVVETESKGTELFPVEKEITFSNAVKVTSSRDHDFEELEKVISNVKQDIKNNIHTGIETEVNNFKFAIEGSKSLLDSENPKISGEQIVLREIRNSAEPENQEVNINILEVSSESAQIVEHTKKSVDGDKTSDSEDDLTLVFEESQGASADSGNCTQECSPPTLSQWSRGEVATSSGGLVKGSCVLTNALESSSTKVSGSSIITQTSDRSVSSQMGCKEMSAFTKFARNMRKQILEENPHMSFTRVAQHLQEKWRNLNVDERKKFEVGVPVKKVASPPSASKQKTLFEMKNGLNRKKPNIELDINLDDFKQMVKCTKSVVEETNYLIGHLEASPLWLYCGPDSSINVFSVLRLMEAVKFHQHMDNFALPSKSLDSNISLYPGDLGEAKWNLLLSLERSPNGVVRDLRILNNGFVVEIGEGEARLTYVPHHISYCGVDDLQELLELLEAHGPEATLGQCRPLKIISFLRSEVMRECSLEDPPTDHQQVSVLLSYWLSHVIQQTQHCIHHLPVTEPLIIP